MNVSAPRRPRRRARPRPPRRCRAAASRAGRRQRDGGRAGSRGWPSGVCGRRGGAGARPPARRETAPYAAVAQSVAKAPARRAASGETPFRGLAPGAGLVEQLELAARARAISRLTASPSPVPCSSPLVVKNDSNSRWRIALAMPEPLSATSTIAKRGLSASTRARTWTTGCAMPGDRVQRVGEQVDQDLLERVRPSHQQRQVGGDLRAQRRAALRRRNSSSDVTRTSTAPSSVRRAAASWVAGTDSRRRFDTSAVRRSDCSTMWRAKSSTSSSSTPILLEQELGETLDREQRLAQLVDLLRGEPAELGQPSGGGQQHRAGGPVSALSALPSCARIAVLVGSVAHLSAGFFHRSVASGVSAGGGGGRRVSVVVACLRVADEVLGLDLDRRLADAHRHVDRELPVGADGGRLQPPRRAHGDDRRRRRAALDLGVARRGDRRVGQTTFRNTSSEMCSGSSGGPPACAADAVPAAQRDGFAAGGEARVPAMAATETRPCSSASTTKRAGPVAGGAGVARVDRQRAGRADAGEHLAAPQIDAGAAGGVQRRRPRWAPPAGPPAPQPRGGSRRRRAARSPFRPPAAAPRADAAEVRTTSVRVSLSPWLDRRPAVRRAAPRPCRWPT